MPTRSIMDRLRASEVLLMDGATGSELGRRGVNVSKGSTKDRLAAWSATANIDAPNMVRQVHEDYLNLGAEIIISNNFWTSRGRLSLIGLQDEWEEYTRAAAELAVQARDAVNPEAYIAGGVAPPGQGDLTEEYKEQARVLADVGVDLMLPEYVGSVEDCVAAVDACATVGLPVFLGVRHIQPDGSMQYGDTFEDLSRALQGHPVDGVLIMCTRPDGVSAGLPKLRAAFDGIVGAYPNTGYGRNPNFGESRSEQWHSIDMDTYPPRMVAEYAAKWKEMGAQVIGGCCACGPEHIEAMAPVVKSS